jgi:hypothetical protein
LDEYFRINSPKVVHEIIDGEAVIINMDIGYYYSADQVGAVIWERIGKIASVREVVEAVGSRYTGSREQIEGAVRQFLAELQRENLIIATTAPEKFTTGKDIIGEVQEDSSQSAFIPPTLSKYTDMEYLLMLDPIHEVDESGWPHALTDKK